MILTFDTECVGLQGGVYDIAYAIHNRKGEIVTRKNWLVWETITNAEKMMGAFFAKKIFSHYIPMIARDEVTLKSWQEITDEMRADIIDYKIDTVAAYNLGFDQRMMQRMAREFKTGKILQVNTKLLDIWQFSCETLLNKRTYKKIADAHGWKTEKGNYKTSAEMVYRFLSGQPNFVEDHTALSDVNIEVEILTACFKRKKKIPYGIYNASPWRLVK